MIAAWIVLGVLLCALTFSAGMCIALVAELAKEYMQFRQFRGK